MNKQRKKKTTSSWRFIALQITGALLTGAGIFFLGIGALFLFDQHIFGDSQNDLLPSTILGVGFAGFFLIFGFITLLLGEVISLFLAIEQNTRHSNNIMLAQLNLLSAMAHKADVPLEQINVMIKDFGIELKE